MCRGGRAFLGYCFLQRENDGHAGETHERHIAKIVHVGPQTRLSVESPVDQSISLLQCCGGGSSSLRSELVLRALNCSSDSSASGSERSHQFVAMHLLVARDDGVHYRNPDASADVAHQIVEAAGVANFFILQKCHRGSRERNEDTSRAETADQDGP